MKPVDPLGVGELRVLGANQPQYNPLPVRVVPSPEGFTRSRWQLTEDERRALLDGACIEITQMTFNEPLQPISVKVEGVGELIELPQQEPE